MAFASLESPREGILYGPGQSVGTIDGHAYIVGLSISDSVGPKIIVCQRRHNP